MIHVDIEGRMRREDQRATQLHGDIPSPDRGMVILMEEVGEAAQRVLEYGRPATRLSTTLLARDYAINELIEVATTAARLATQLMEDKWPDKTR